jgi:transcription elongation factor Elf1
MSCPKCAKHRLIAIGVTIGEDEVTMRSCSHCGARWWECEGQRVPLPKVLELAVGNR